MATLLEQDTSTGGIEYRIWQKANGGCVIEKWAVNYSRGRNIGRWVYVVPARTPVMEAERMRREGMEYNAAMTLYCKRIKSKAR